MEGCYLEEGPCYEPTLWHYRMSVVGILYQEEEGDRIVLLEGYDDK